jgi:hypothetical protein
VYGQAGYEKDGSLQGVNQRGYPQAYGSYESKKRVYFPGTLIKRLKLSAVAYKKGLKRSRIHHQLSGFFFS